MLMPCSYDCVFRSRRGSRALDRAITTSPTENSSTALLDSDFGSSASKCLRNNNPSLTTSGALVLMAVPPGQTAAAPASTAAEDGCRGN